MSQQKTGTARRGLLYMLLGATVYYFATGSSPLQFPVDVPDLAIQAFLPLLFAGGQGLALFEQFRPVPTEA